MGKRGPLPVNKLPTVDCPEPSKESKDRERRYKAEEGLRTLQRAKECEADKGLMRDIKALAKEEMKKLKKI